MKGTTTAVLFLVLLANCQALPYDQEWTDLGDVYDLPQKLSGLGQRITENVHKIIEEAKKAAGNFTVIQNGNSHVITSTNGVSNIVQSNWDEKGHGYIVQDVIVNNVKNHTVRRYNPETNTWDVASYTMNTNDSNPEWHNSTEPANP